MKLGCLWLVGDRKNIKFWSDPWIPTIQGFKPLFVHNAARTIHVVGDLMIAGERKWKEDLIINIFDQFTDQHILSTQIHSDVFADS